jgi:hypothetical protein
LSCNHSLFINHTITCKILVKRVKILVKRVRILVKRVRILVKRVRVFDVYHHFQQFFSYFVTARLTGEKTLDGLTNQLVKTPDLW